MPIALLSGILDSFFSLGNDIGEVVDILNMGVNNTNLLRTYIELIRDESISGIETK